MTNRLVLAAIVVATAVSPATAQFSSDIPGVPRASLSARGHQTRMEFTLSGYRIPGTSGDTLAGGLRFGFGSSYRILSQFELGYDVTLVDGYAIQPPATTTGVLATRSPMYLRGLAAYGFRVGGKWRPIAIADRDGNGIELAVGASLQPELKPLYGVEKLGDSVRQGGQFSKEEPQTSAYFKTNPFAKVSPSTNFAGMASIRAGRLIADVAVVAEQVPDRSTPDQSPVGPFDGVSTRVGASFRLLSSIAVGGAYWGNGAPPWRDEVRLDLPGVQRADEYAFLLQFGGERDGGIDLMYASPTGNYAQSGRLYVRARAVR
ncbi:MAG TPA: hypothetical protein VIP11_10530 [Gemmatimonadaceae bacterium]